MATAENTFIKCVKYNKFSHRPNSTTIASIHQSLILKNKNKNYN